VGQQVVGPAKPVERALAFLDSLRPAKPGLSLLLEKSTPYFQPPKPQTSVPKCCQVPERISASILDLSPTTRNPKFHFPRRNEEFERNLRRTKVVSYAKAAYYFVTMLLVIIRVRVAKSSHGPDIYNLGQESLVAFISLCASIPEICLNP
jgi:hypothetical protein